MAQLTSTANAFVSLLYRSLMSTMQRIKEFALACPFFMPVKVLEGGAWSHPARLPLGNGWDGVCQAPGHEGAQPSDDELHHFCNLGYARCGRIPENRDSDAVRLGIASDRGSEIVLTYVLEKSHSPIARGSLNCDLLTGSWPAPHPDIRIQKMAECFLESYLARRSPRSFAASANS